MRSVKIKRFGAGRALAFALLAAWALITLFPLLWLFQTSFMPKAEIDAIPPVWASSRLTVEHYQSLFEGLSLDGLFTREGIVRWFLNSAIISVSATSLVLLVASMAGYGFAKKEFPGRNVMFWAIIATMMIPAQVTLVPVFMMLASLRIVDTLWAVILPASASTFGCFMMRQFLLSTPSDYIDAARIDGCGEWGIYWRIVLPLVKPALAVLAIFTFIGEWNSYLWPLIVLHSPEKYPLTVGLATLQRQNIAEYGLQAAGAAVSAVPMLIVFFAFQKYFMKGLTLGGTKG